MSKHEEEKEEKEEPKGYREGPSLGSGMLEEARKELLGRRKTIEEAIKEAGG